jgi:hypothetical protein
MARLLSRLTLACLLAAACSVGWSQTIYTCVDAKGRRLTSDRQIPECIDREQKELNSSGTVRRSIAPIPTAQERVVLEEKERKENEEKQRQAEERRMQRALLTRYPNQSVHDMERAKALRAAQDVIVTSQRRIVELQQEHKQLDVEAEFYKDRAKWPVKLKRQMEDNEQQTVSQQRFIAAQDEEKRRIEKRFDDELAKLKLLWNQASTASAPAAPVR